MILFKMKLISIIIKIFYLLILLKIKKKKELDFILSDIKILALEFNTLKFYTNVLVLILFIVFYVGVFRLMKLFISSKYIDLKEIIFIIQTNLCLYYVIIILLLIFLFRELKILIIFFLKKSFFEVSYFYQASSDFFSENYPLVVRWQHFLWHWLLSGKTKYKYKKQLLYIIYFFFKYVGLILLVISFFVDLICNNLVLENFCFFLPWVCFYQTIFLLNQFFDKKVNLKNEYYVYTYLYLEKLHKKFLYKEYRSKKLKISFEVYYNININIMGNVPSLIDKNTFTQLNNYILFLFK